MFSSNQKILITGDLKHSGDLENALEFILTKRYGESFNPKYKYPDAFQITEDNKYVLGCIYGEKKDGWTPYPFDTNIEILAPIIRQHLLKQDFPSFCEGDGSESKGYLITNENCKSFSDRNGIKNAHYSIITIEPYTCFYAK